jgi:hypothetical protein
VRVIDFGEGALKAPIKLEAGAFLVFEPLIFFHQQQLKLGADPHPEMEGDVLVGVGATIPSGLGCEANGASMFYPLFHRDHKVVAPAAFLIVPKSV